MTRSTQWTLAAAVALIAVLGAATVLRSSGQQAAQPIVRSSQQQAAQPIRILGTGLVEPLCGHPAYQVKLPPPYNGPGTCPRVIPAGRYASAITGVHLVWPFTFSLPDGWEVAEIPGVNGLDFKGPGSNTGLSIIVYPGGPRGSSFLGSETLAEWVSKRTYVDASPVTRVSFAGGPAWQVDVRPRVGAPQLSICRVGTLCVPLLRPTLGAGGFNFGRPATAVALLEHTTSRLIFFGENGLSLSSVLWIWDINGSLGTTAGEAERVVTSMHFEDHLCC